MIRAIVAVAVRVRSRSEPGNPGDRHPAAPVGVVLIGD